MEVEILPGVKHACSTLREAGFLLILVTNQPDVARGAQSPDVVNAINSYLQSELGLDLVKTCPHDDGDGCDCRKPKPGMLLEAASECRIDLLASFLVGDRWRDIEAGRRAGCGTVWLDQGYDEPAAVRPDLIAKTLAEASRWILKSHTGTRGAT
jgi:D-glycero-D-manno-heptose 1,7-bisphosphate phosphatase